MAPEPILSVRDLVVEFDTPQGPVTVIDRVSFDAYPNEVLCIVGESSSGKSVTMLAVMRLLPAAARIVGGQILFRGRDMATISSAEMRELRGGELAMIFQDPMTSLNPVLRVGHQIEEMIRLHTSRVSRSELRRRTVELLGQVQIPNAADRYSSFPHEFSGGMRQRAMIAMAMANEPSLLIADEPTTALDVTVQAQVLDVLREMQERTGTATVLITHDLGVVAEVADRVVVMYCGRVMETGTVDQLFTDPRHPYTAGLMGSLLRMDAEVDVLHAIRGQPPTPVDRPGGCPFHPRCSLARGQPCADREPVLEARNKGHSVACHFTREVPAWIERDLPQIRDMTSGVSS